MSILPGISGGACLLSGIALAATLFGSGRAEAETTSCSALSTTGITFSPYDSVSRAAVPGIGTITLTCRGTGTSRLNLALLGGNSGACSPREMRGTRGSLRYDIYKDSARSQIWCSAGQRYDITLDYSSGSTQTRTITLYGRVGAGQTAPYGSYADTLYADLKKGGGVLMTIPVPISGSVAATCLISAGTLAFGAYLPATPKDASATVSVNCTDTAPYQVSLGTGRNSSGGTRRMAGPNGSFLSYTLHRNAARTSAWGDGGAIGAKVAGTGTGTAQSLTVYGRIPSGQNNPPGSYSDSVFVTVDY